MKSPKIRGADATNIRLRPFEYVAKTLPSGLRVVVVPQPWLHRSHMALYVRTGSRFESESTNGISHFLEHMIYRGTPKLPSAHRVNFAFEEVGGFLQAATHVDFGVFGVSMPQESLDTTSRLFGEVIKTPLFADIDVEKKIVCEEILEDRDEDGREVDPDNLSRKLIYPAHPLGFTITGTEEHVSSFTEDHLRSHHARHYTSESSVLVLSGCLDVNHALALAERDFGSLQSGLPVDATPPVHKQVDPRFLYVDSASSQTSLRISMRTVSESSQDRPTMDMMMRLIDDGMSTRLYRRIADDQGLCYDVSAVYDGYEDDGILDFAANVQHAQAAKVTGEILAMMHELATHGPTQEELEKARKRNAWEVESLRDSAEDLGGFFAGGLLFNRFETPEERLTANANVSCEAIKALAQAITAKDKLSVVAVGTLTKEEESDLRRTIGLA